MRDPKTGRPYLPLMIAWSRFALILLHQGKIAEMEIYFAGPPPMADAIMKMAITHKAPAAQLHFDKFY